MKTRLLITVISVVALLFSTATPAFASGDTDPTSVVVDVAVARPFTFALTILGSALFVVSLPVAIPSQSVGKAAQALVVAPAKDTFTRPLGDLHDFLED
jgi:formate hydrogenlyase subunit 4